MTVLRVSVPAAAVAAQVDRIVGSPHFSASPRLQAFLEFIVEETIAGRGAALKEYCIATAVYQRPSSFDPKVDSIVRSEARRLRARLQAYYDGEGAADPVLVQLPLGRYVPEFVERDATPTGPTGREPAQPRPATWALLAAAGIIVVVGVLAVLQGRDVSAPPSRVAVLIVPFEYGPAIPLPTGTIESAIEFALAPSRVVHAVPRVRVNDALRLMRLDPATPLTPEIATGVAARDTGINVVLTGRVTSSHGRMTVAAWLRDAESGRAMASIRLPLPTPEEGFATASTLASWLRVSVRDVEERRPLEPVATPSLAAVRSYSRGLDQLDQGQWAAAETFFRDALEEDPQFASAQIYHAWTLRAIGRPNTDVLALARHAEALASHASERERLFIRASVRQLEGRHSEALQLFEALLAIDPAHRWALRNLAFSFGLPSRQAGAYWMRLADLRPNDANLALEVAVELIRSNSPREDAEKYLRRARALNVDADTACVIDHFAAFYSWTRSDVRPWSRAVDCARVTPPRPRHAVAFGLLLISAGRPSDAMQALPRIGDPVGMHRWSAIASAAANDRESLDRHARALAGTRANALSTILQIWAGHRAASAESFKERGLSLVPGATAEHIDAYWQVARAEYQRAFGEAPAKWSDQYAAALQALAGMPNPEYFIAAYRAAETAQQTGDIAMARLTLEAAVARRAEAYETSIIFWLGCLDQLVKLERHAANPARAAYWSALLADALAGAEPKFEPGALFNVSAQSRSSRLLTLSSLP